MNELHKIRCYQYERVIPNKERIPNMIRLNKIKIGDQHEEFRKNRRWYKYECDERKKREATNMNGLIKIRKCYQYEWVI